MMLRDRYGWPVELVIGRPVLNAFRRVLVTSWRETWRRRHEPWPPVPEKACVFFCERYPDCPRAVCRVGAWGDSQSAAAEKL